MTDNEYATKKFREAKGILHGNPAITAEWEAPDTFAIYEGDEFIGMAITNNRKTWSYNWYGADIGISKAKKILEKYVGMPNNEATRTAIADEMKKFFGGNKNAPIDLSINITSVK